MQTTTDDAHNLEMGANYCCPGRRPPAEGSAARKPGGRAGGAGAPAARTAPPPSRAVRRRSLTSCRRWAAAGRAAPDCPTQHGGAAKIAY